MITGICGFFLFKRQNEVAAIGDIVRNAPGLPEVLAKHGSAGLRVRKEILSKWLLLTRLETRTKECNTYASLRVEKPIRRNESKNKM